LTLTKEIRINDFVLVLGLCLTTISAGSEVESIKKELESRHNKKLPEVEVRYSDNIYGAKAIHPLNLPSRMPAEEKNEIYRQRDNDLKSFGLKDYELENIDRSKITIFMPRCYRDYPTRLYGASWEELGHGIAYAFDIENKVANESVALAYRFKGLLQGAKEGKFPFKEAVVEIELDMKEARSFPYSIDRHYNKALDIIRQYNSGLKFRDRDPGGLIMELDKCQLYFKCF
jgi:hypothetical protein